MAGAAGFVNQRTAAGKWRNSSIFTPNIPMEESKRPGKGDGDTE